ncbi:hypothetical protein D3C78_1661050 [compost metagenome]
MIVHHRFGHPGHFGEIAEGQGVRAFGADDLPGDIEQLAQAIFTGQATPRSGGVGFADFSG